MILRVLSEEKKEGDAMVVKNSIADFGFSSQCVSDSLSVTIDSLALALVRKKLRHHGIRQHPKPSFFNQSFMMHRKKPEDA